LKDKIGALIATLFIVWMAALLISGGALHALDEWYRSLTLDQQLLLGIWIVLGIELEEIGREFGKLNKYLTKEK
jgi:hypothetical protein